MAWLADRWCELPTWAKWTLAIAAVISLDAIRMARGERRFVGAFFESFVAELLYAGVPIVALVAGVAVGVQTHGRTNSKALGWILGIGVFLAIGSIRVFADDVPGVGWRIKAMEEAREYSDY